MAKKLIRVALHIEAASPAEVVNKLKPIIDSESCLGVEIVVAKDDSIYSVFDKNKNYTPGSEPQDEEEYFEGRSGEYVIYIDQESQEAFPCKIMFRQGDRKYGIRLEDGANMLVDRDRLVRF